MNRYRNAAASLLAGVFLLAAPAMSHHGAIKKGLYSSALAWRPGESWTP